MCVCVFVWVFVCEYQSIKALMTVHQGSMCI